MEFKRGQVFYGCWPYTDDDTGRVEITVDEWVVRSVQKKRNSQQRWGVPKFTPDNTVYVNLTQRVVDLTTHRKTGAWMKSIPACCRRQFIAANGLPSYLFTTPLQALKYALKVADTDAERRAVKSRITKLRNKMELTAMFIYGGYRDVLGTDGKDSSLINETYCGGGEVEAARALNCVADDVDNAITPLLAEQDGPGVWYYDVAEPLGAWIAETAAAGVRVDESDIVAKAVELTNEWLREVNQ